MLRLECTTHLLTHVDAPRHFFEGGASLDQIHVARFCGEALVIEAEGDVVLPGDVPGEAQGLNLLFKTRNSARWNASVYDREHVSISPAAAEVMAARGVNLAGIDYLSVDRCGDESYPVHRTLLGAGVLILEGIDLAGVTPGRYHLSALPLKIAGGDGSPVRAVLSGGLRP
jgi:arylformamidase